MQVTSQSLVGKTIESVVELTTGQCKGCPALKLKKNNNLIVFTSDEENNGKGVLFIESNKLEQKQDDTIICDLEDEVAVSVLKGEIIESVRFDETGFGWKNSSNKGFIITTKGGWVIKVGRDEEGNGSGYYYVLNTKTRKFYPLHQ